MRAYAQCAACFCAWDKEKPRTFVRGFPVRIPRCSEAQVHAELRGLNVSPVEAVINVFELRRPVACEGPLDAAAERVTGVADMHAERADAGEGKTAGAVDQHAIPGIAQTRARGADIVDVHR